MISPQTDTVSAAAAARTDRELAMAFLTGEQAAFDQLVARHRGLVHATCLSHRISRQDAEELLWDTFAKAATCLHRFQWRCKLATWLFLIATGLCHNRRNRELRRGLKANLSMDGPMVLEDGTYVNPSLFTKDGRAGFVDDVMWDELDAMVKRVEPALPTREREVFRLRRTKHMDYTQIARVVNVPEGTVKSRLFRARERIARSVLDHHPELHDVIGRAGRYRGMHVDA